jgi:hypothetical protein
MRRRMTPSPWDRERAGVRVALIRPLTLTLSPEGRGERRVP